MAKPGQIFVSKDTDDRLAGAVRAVPLGPIRPRGRRSAIEVFAIEE